MKSNGFSRAGLNPVRSGSIVDFYPEREIALHELFDLKQRAKDDRNITTYREKYAERPADGFRRLRMANLKSPNASRGPSRRTPMTSRDINDARDLPKLVNILQTKLPSESEHTNLYHQTCRKLDELLALKSTANDATEEELNPKPEEPQRSPAWNRMPREGCGLVRPASVSSPCWRNLPPWKPLDPFGPCQCPNSCCLRAIKDWPPTSRKPGCTCALQCTPKRKGSRPCPDCFLDKMHTADDHEYSCPRVDFERPLNRSPCFASLLEEADRMRPPSKERKEYAVKQHVGWPRLTRQVKRQLQQDMDIIPIHNRHVVHWPETHFTTPLSSNKWILHTPKSSYSHKMARRYSLPDDELIGPNRGQLMFPQYRVRLLHHVDLPIPYRRRH